MVQVKINTKFKIPKIDLSKDLIHIAKNILVKGMIGGINRNQSISGGNFPELESNTVKMKGHDRPLINTRKLLQSFISKRKGKEKVIVTLKDQRKEIGKYLQIDGIRSKRGLKIFEFFGISELMEKQAISYMNKRIKKAIRDAR